MNNDNRGSKYIRSKGAVEEKKTETEKESKEKYRKNVITPKRARELAEAEAAKVSGEADDEAQTAPEETAKKEERSASEKREDKKQEYRKSVITPKRARELSLAQEEHEEQPAVEETPEEPRERIQSKGSAKEIFSTEGADENQEMLFTAEAINSSKTRKNSAAIRMVISLLILTGIASLLQFLTFRVPFVPRVFTVEFSAIPELIAAIAYGPVFGITVCVLKNIVHIIAVPTSLISAFTNLLLDTVFLFFAGTVYYRLMKRRDRKTDNKKKNEGKLYSSVRMIFSSLLGALLSLIPQFFITRYVAFPLMEKMYREEGFSIAALHIQYQNCVEGLRSYLPDAIGKMLPNISDIGTGVLVFNLPVTFVKLLIVTLITALLLKIFLPFLQFRNKNAGKN